MTTQPADDFEMETAATPSSGENDFDPVTYNAFIGDLNLADIELVKIQGERTGAGAASQISFDMAASYMRDTRAIYYRYEVTAHFSDDNGLALGNTAASIQITARTAMAVSEACIEHFGGTSGVLIAHPYLREAIASTAQRIGFSGVLLPMIKQQPEEPED